MKMKTVMIGLVLMALVLAPMAMAAPGDGPRGDRGPRGGDEQGRRGPAGPGGFQGGFGWMLLGRAGDKLALTDEQRDQIKAILDESKKSETKDAIAEAMKALHEATAEGDKAKVTEAGKALGDAFTQRALQQIETMPLRPPRFIVSTALLGTITNAPFSFSPSKSMFIARRCRAVGLST